MAGGLLSRWRNSRRRQLHAFPIGPEGELPWHGTPSQVRQILSTQKAASHNVGGAPSVRMRWPDRTLRATLEFADGVCLGPQVFLSALPGFEFLRRDGTKRRLGPQLRAANVHFEKSQPRANWKWVLRWLGKPDERLPDGSWHWNWEAMTARYYEADPVEQTPEWMRFAATARARPLEIVNQSSLDLYSHILLRLDFRQGTWVMGDRPDMAGVPTRLHWDTPANEVLLITATVDGVETSAEVPRRAHRVVLTNTAGGGLRIVV